MVGSGCLGVRFEDHVAVGVGGLRRVEEAHDEVLVDLAEAGQERSGRSGQGLRRVADVDLVELGV